MAELSSNEIHSGVANGYRSQGLHDVKIHFYCTSFQVVNSLPLTVHVHNRIMLYNYDFNDFFSHLIYQRKYMHIAWISFLWHRKKYCQKSRCDNNNIN